MELFHADENGCNVAGCSVHPENYSALSEIPEWLAKVQNMILRKLPSDEMELWKSQFLKSIPSGLNWNNIKNDFLIFILKSTLSNFDQQKFPQVYKAIIHTINLLKDKNSSKENFEKAMQRTDFIDWCITWESEEESAREAANVASWVIRNKIWDTGTEVSKATREAIETMKMAAWEDLFKERAAILEYEGGLPRKEAESKAKKFTHAYSSQMKNPYSAFSQEIINFFKNIGINHEKN